MTCLRQGHRGAGDGHGDGTRPQADVSTSSRHWGGGGRGVGRSDPWKEEDSGGGMYGGDGQGKYLPGRCLPSFREHLEHLLWAESP